MLDSTLFNQISFGISDRAAYSDLNPDDGGQSLYPMNTVLSLYRTALNYPLTKMESKLQLALRGCAWLCVIFMMALKMFHFKNG